MKLKDIWRAAGTALLLGIALTARSQGFATLHNFTNAPDGANPRQLTWANGFFYGPTDNGGSGSSGCIYRFNPSGSVFTTIYNFSGATNNGNTPADLAVDGGMIYGATKLGGTNGVGMIFAVNTNGAGFTSLYSFGFPPDGYYPIAGLILNGAALFGTASAGGANGGGTLFKINTNGTGYTILHLFTNAPDGASPQGELVAAGGVLFGNTSLGGSGNRGTLFAININGGGYTILHNFTNAPEGNYPYGGLILDSGLLYGTTLLGGSNNNGTVFVMNTNGSGFKILHHFAGTTGNADGSLPRGTMALSAGILYGTTSGGGSGTGGTLFQINTDGTGFAVIRSFASNPGDAKDLENGVALLGNTIWGTTYAGGTSGYGVLYSLSLGPAISQQPRDMTVVSGNPASFTNVASGAAPLSYQWYLNTSTPVGGGTNAILLIPSATTLQAGFYSVVVTNIYGSITSSAAKLTVNVTATAPSIAQQPQSLTVTNGNPASFTAAASGTAPLFYQWYFNTNTPVSGGTGATLNLPSVTTLQAGYYSVIVTNVAGSATSSAALLTVMLPTVGPVITQQPQNNVVTNGYDASFTSVASGNGPLSYQWYFNTNTAVSSGTNNILVVTFAGTNNAGYYRVIVTNASGTATSAPALLTVISTKPIIFAPPQALTVTNGDTGSFTVLAAGQSLLRYQWYSNSVSTAIGTRLSGKTNSTYSFTSGTNSNGRFYSVVITNALGKATSSPAMLTVISKPVIATNPQPQTVSAGATATFSVTALGAGLRFQWYSNSVNTAIGAALAGQTNGTCSFTAAANQDGSFYSVVVTNTFGRVTSAPPARLTVQIAATGQPKFLDFSFDPVSSSFSFTVSNTGSSANRLWASTNLNSTILWNVIASNVMPANGLWLFTDTNVGRTNQVRFYRASNP